MDRTDERLVTLSTSKSRIESDAALGSFAAKKALAVAICSRDAWIGTVV